VRRGECPWSDEPLPAFWADRPAQSPAHPDLFFHQVPIPDVDALIRDHYDLGELDDDDEEESKRKQRNARKARGGGVQGGVAQQRAQVEQCDVEAILTPDQRRPSDAEPPEWGAIWGQQVPSSGGFGGGGRGTDPDAQRMQREQDEQGRFVNEIQVRGQLDDTNAVNGQRAFGGKGDLDAEEAEVKSRIGQVEGRINTILQQPLGADGLGRKKVWRVRPTKKIWSDTLGDKPTKEVLRDTASGVASGATLALRCTAQAMSAGASRVVSWSYKPALWSAAELAGDTVVVATKGAMTAASAVGRGLYNSANTVVETVDENTAELDQLQSELSHLSDRLGAIDAKRSGASLRLITPHEGTIWYANHACNVDWESRGVIQEVRISIARRVTSLFGSWTELARGVPDAGSWSYIVPPSLDRGWYCLRVEGPLGVPSVTSDYFLIEHEIPPLMLWVEDHRLTYHRSEACRVHWAFRDDAGPLGGDVIRRQHAAHSYVQQGESVEADSWSRSSWGKEQEEADVSSSMAGGRGSAAGGDSAIKGPDGGNMAESWVKLYLRTGLPLPQPEHENAQGVRVRDCGWRFGCKIWVCLL
jgi:hypothetical protein